MKYAQISPYHLGILRFREHHVPDNGSADKRVAALVVLPTICHDLDTM
jgi:hypothetical protein